eukprot:TRINITY_DN107699_c0_g1_i1.p1 TRINITY_DN107699_c0_g1~~TRINITY_DN107699_c0_g1_i1.p1  ORF type:complete len:981 (+),score=173.04 TRINITY_DN107699_c0_g1_i1:43-2943(+)
MGASFEDAKKVPPPQLYLTSPNGQQKLGGIYLLLDDQLANGMPIWKRAGKGEEAWLYSGTTGKWYVSTNKVVEESKFQCGRGHVCSVDTHLGKMPHKEVVGWQYKDQDGWHRDYWIRFRPVVPAAPTVLWLTFPNAHQKLAGEYRHDEGQLANGQPYWKRAGSGEEVWLYSGSNAKWYVSNKREVLQKNFNCSAGQIASECQHLGVMPHLLANCWGVKSQDGWRQDSDIRIETDLQPTLPAVLHVSSPSRHRKVAGKYELLEERINGQPAWRRAGLGEQAWLYSGTNGKWCVSAHKVLEKDFNCNLAHLSSAQLHNGELPHKLAKGSWAFKSEEGWQLDPEISIQQTSESIPGVLYIASPSAHQKTGGKYVLLEGELANGNPIWCKRGLAEQKLLLYTGADGRWYVSSSPETVQKKFCCSLGLISSALPHGGLLPHVAEGWLLDSSAGWCPDDKIQVLTTAPAVPAVLFLSSQTQHQKMSGRYELLEGKLVSEQPVWKRVGCGEEAWIYSGSNGKWCVSGQRASERQFKCSLGQLTSVKPHGALMPHLLPDGWGVRDCSRASSKSFAPSVTSDDLCQADPDVRVEESCPPVPAELYLDVTNCHRRFAGKYALHEGQFANGQPIWKRVGYGEEVLLYSGANGHWHVSSNKVVEKDFNCNTGSIASFLPHGGFMPQFSVQWQVREDDSWMPYADIKVLTSFAIPTSVLYLEAPDHQQKEGVYRLLQGEFANGQPVWKCSGAGEDNWLYSSLDAFWCVNSSFTAELKVSDRNASWDRDALCSTQPHNGVMPQMLSQEGWSSKCELAWQQNSRIKVLASPPEGPAVLHVNPEVSSLDEGHRVIGKYWLVQGQLTNDRPYWKKAGTGEEAFLYSGNDGAWYLNKVLDAEIHSSHGCMTSTQARLRPSSAGSLLRKEGSRSPTNMPSLLHVTCIMQGGQFVTGKYGLVDGQLSTPVWKRVESLEDSWMYSRT